MKLAVNTNIHFIQQMEEGKSYYHIMIFRKKSFIINHVVKENDKKNHINVHLIMIKTLTVRLVEDVSFSGVTYKRVGPGILPLICV